MENNTPINLNEKAILFLTSSTGEIIYENGIFKTNGFFKKNDFEKNLKKYWKEKSKILYITADPNSQETNNSIIDSFKNSFYISNLSYNTIELCDGFNNDQNLAEYDVIILGGGHVPTQNKFFEKINLYERIKKFEGIIIGISAGTMNSADVVYAQPELDGEAIDPNYKRFIKGLNLTKYQILPHYYSVKDEKLDDLRIIEDISYGDSVGRCFYVLPDGSYIFQTKNESYLYGEGYIIKDKKMTKINVDNKVIKL